MARATAGIAFAAVVALAAGAAGAAVASREDGAAAPRGVGPSAHRAGVEAPVGLARFADCEAFAAHIRRVAAFDVERYARARSQAARGGSGGGGGMTPPPAETFVLVGGDVRMGGVGYGPIGVREPAPGVTRPDVAQVAGTKVVTLGRREGRAVLDVVETAGRKPRPLGSVSFDMPDGDGELLLLGGTRALAIHQTRDTVLTLLDLADPAHPSVVGSSRVPGSYAWAAERDGVARVAISSPVRVPVPPADPTASDEQAVVRARQALADAPPETFLPEHSATGPDGAEIGRGRLLGCTDLMVPQRDSGLGILNVLAVDPARGMAALTDPAVTGVAAGEVGVHGADDRLYLATRSGGRAYRWAAGNWERTSAGPMRTAVHVLDVAGRGLGRHIATGEVPGHQIDRGGMSAYAGHVRIATSTVGHAASTSRTQQSRILILREEGGRLRTVGTAPGLRKGMFVHFVNWFGPYATVGIGASKGDVRLFDLSDPARPRLRGALTTSGYPQGQTGTGPGRVLDVRYSAENVLTVQGFALSGGARGARTGNFAYPQTWTRVGDDTRTATWVREHRLAFVPVARSEGSPRLFVLAFRVARDGRVTEAGRYAADGVAMRVLGAGGRLAVVTTTSVAVLEPDGLRAVGSVRTAKRAWARFGA